MYFQPSRLSVVVVDTTMLLINVNGSLRRTVEIIKPNISKSLIVFEKGGKRTSG